MASRNLGKFRKLQHGAVVKHFLYDTGCHMQALRNAGISSTPQALTLMPNSEPQDSPSPTSSAGRKRARWTRNPYQSKHFEHETSFGKSELRERKPNVRCFRSRKPST